MKILLKGSPLSTQHIYGMRGRIKFMTKEGKKQKESYISQAKEQWQWEPIEGDVKLQINIFFGDNRKRDWDNYHKLSMDALSGIVYQDDSQIVEALVKKYVDKENPRIEIML